MKKTMLNIMTLKKIVDWEKIRVKIGGGHYGEIKKGIYAG
jgi:hypothetical protein